MSKGLLDEENNIGTKRIEINNTNIDAVFDELSNLFWDLCTGFTDKPKKIETLSAAIKDSYSPETFEQKVSRVLGNSPGFAAENAKESLTKLCYDEDTARLWLQNQSAYDFSEAGGDNLQDAMLEIQAMTKYIAKTAKENASEIAYRIGQSSNEAFQNQAFEEYEQLLETAKTAYIAERDQHPNKEAGKYTKKILDERIKLETPKASCCNIL